MNYNIIENDDTFIGSVENIVNKFKEEINNQITDIDLFNKDSECNNIENKQDNVDLYLEFINGLYQDIITGTLLKNSVIKVEFNPMGAYQYEQLKEDDIKDLDYDIKKLQIVGYSENGNNLDKGIKEEIYFYLGNIENEKICKLNDKQMDNLVDNVLQNVMNDDQVWNELHLSIEFYANKYLGE